MRLIALEYHDVVTAGAPDASGFPGRAAASYKMLLEEFDGHLAALESVDRARRVLARDAGNDANPAAGLPLLLTFDDGGASALSPIAERLERWGWRGHFFIATDCIGTPGFLTGDGLRELASRGHVVGSHSCSHPLRMSSLPPDRLLAEWTVSVDRLQQVLGMAVTVGSVPGGGYSRKVAAAASTAGIRILFTSEPTSSTHTVNGCTVLGRFTLRAGSRVSFVSNLAAGNGLSRASEWTRWNAKKLAKLAAGAAYLRVRDWILDGRDR